MVDMPPISSAQNHSTMKDLLDITRLPFKADGAITQIKSVIERRRTTLEHPSITTTGQIGQPFQGTSISRTDADALEEIENIIKGLGINTPDLRLDGEIQEETPEPPNDALWQTKTPLPIAHRTHPVSFEPYDYHINDLQKFKNDLLAAKECSNATKAAYKKVEVLLITWDETDIEEELEKETKALTELFHELNYHVNRYRIPFHNARNDFQFEVLNFLRTYEKGPADETLFLIYYTGHGSVRNDACYWHPTAMAASPRDRRDLTSEQNGPTIEWSRIQENFQYTNHDILFILDCCYAGAALMHKSSGPTKEILAACSSQEQTRAGEQSFTIRLVKCVRKMIKEKPIFQVAWLYESLISASKSPFCLHVNLNRSPSSIFLSSLTPAKEKTGMSEEHLAPSSPYLSPSSAASTPAASVFSGENDTLDEGTQLSVPDPDPVEPESWQYRVLLSVKLMANVVPTATEWCLMFPPGQAESLEDVSFQSLYPTKSSLLLLTMPVRQWLLLKDDPAYTFIDFVKSGDILHSSTQNSEPSKALVPVEPLKSNQSVTFKGSEDGHVSIQELSPPKRTDSDEVGFEDSEEGGIVRTLIATMLDFFEKVNLDDFAKGKRTTSFQQKIAMRISGRHSKIEADPRLDLVQMILQKLVVKKNEKGESTGLTYDLHFAESEIKGLFENTKKTLKETIHKVGPKTEELEATIAKECDQLENKVLKKLEVENRGKSYTLNPGLPAEHVKGPQKTHAHMRSRSNASDLPQTEATIPEEEEVQQTGRVVAGDGTHRGDSGVSFGKPRRSDTIKSTSSGMKGFFGKRISSPFQSPRSSAHVSFPSSIV